MLERMKKRESFCTAGRKVNWYRHYGVQYGYLKKLGIKLPYDPAIPLLSIYTEKAIIQKDTCTPIFIAALFTIARTWKQPIYPSTDEWIKKLWYTYTMEYHIAVEEQIWVSGSEMDEPKACCTKWSKSGREKQMYINTYMWNLEKWYWWTYCMAGIETQM